MGCGGSKSDQKQEEGRKQVQSQTKLTEQQADLIGKNIPVNFVGQNNKQNELFQSMHSFDKDAADAVTDNKQFRQKKMNKVRNKIMQGSLDISEVTENIKQISKKMNDSTLKAIESSLTKHFFFGKLKTLELDEIIKKMFYCQINQNQYIFKQGDQASSFFFIESGSFKVEINTEVKRNLVKGDTFGQLALLYSALRSASICALEKCTLWGIGRAEFKKTIETMAELEYETNRVFMESVPFFISMTNEQKNSIAANLVSVKYPKNTFIVNQGDQADSFYMIQSGTVAIYKGDKKIVNLQEGDSFGEQALFEESKRLATVKSETQVVCLSLGRDNLTSILGDKLQLVIFQNIQRRAYNDNELLKGLTQIQKEKLIRLATIQNMAADQILFAAGTTADQYYIILEGEISNQAQTNTLCRQGGIQGYQYLPLNKNQDEIPEQIIAKVPSVVAILQFTIFFKAIGGDVESVIQKNINSHEAQMLKIESRKDYSHVKLDNLLFIQKLGSGQFGNVFLVLDKNDKDKNVYALKSVNKGMVVSQKLEKYLISEKRILEEINFPFIMPFYRTFCDDISLYFLVKNISGMELFDVIREIGLLSTTDSQFYVGTMILCLEYLHGRSIVYRDLKPENIMVDVTGVMYMIDMGTAKLLNKTKTVGRTYTIIGTPHYMAPEIIQGKGYSYAIDLWSVGVCLYEFMCGGIPFAEDASDPFQIYEEIIQQNLKFPNFFKDRKARKLIEQLFNLVPEQRIGGSYAGLKSHPWFDNFDWDKLYNQEMKPPFIPPTQQVTQKPEIDRLAQANQLVIDEIKQENASGNKIPNKQPADPNWDQQFY